MANSEYIWIDISEDFPLYQGNEIKLYFEWYGEGTISRSYQWAKIQASLQSQYPEFFVKSWEVTEDFLIVDIIIREATVLPDSPLAQKAGVGWGTAMCVGIILLGFGIGTWILSNLNLRWALLNTQAKKELAEAETTYAETTTAKLKAAGLTTGSFALLVLAIAYLWTTIKE